MGFNKLNTCMYAKIGTGGQASCRTFHNMGSLPELFRYVYLALVQSRGPELGFVGSPFLPALFAMAGSCYKRTTKPSRSKPTGLHL